MANIDKTNPTDQAQVSQYPANERSSRSALETILAADHVAGNNTADDGKHQIVRLIVQVAPANTAGEGKLYSRNPSGPAELYFKDSVGNEVQLTSGGVVPQASLQQGSGSGLDADKWDGGNKTVSTSAPSGGSNGDVWFQY